MTLTERAAAAAGRTPNNGHFEEDTEQIVTLATQPVGPQLEEIDLGDSPDDYDQVAVHVAWMRVMREVREIRKNGRFSGGGASYNFRGVDAAMNIFGAAQRKHGVIVLPTSSTVHHRDITTKNGNSMRECTVEMTFRIIGPKGDFLECAASGESMDSGDKGTAKAQSVALRTLLLQAGMVPTEARDPDMDNYERGQKAPTPSEYAEEAMDPKTTAARLRTMYSEVGSMKGLGVVVQDQEMTAIALGDLIKREGLKRKESE